MDHELVKSVTSIVQATANLLIPIVAIFLGLKINRQLEATKVNLSREKEWQTKWADSFFLAATAFNQAVEDVIVVLANTRRLTPDEVNERSGTHVAKVQHMEWALKTHVQFAPKNRDAVVQSALEVMKQVTLALKRTEETSLEPLRGALFSFNAASQAAHRELLAL
jgi:hypothetical protein